MIAAQRLGCPPWELDDDPYMTRFVWLERALLVIECEAIVTKWREDKRKRAAARGARRGRRG